MSMFKNHMNKNVIAFRNNLVITKPIEGIDNRELATIVQADLMRYGYILTPEAFDDLSKMKEAKIKKFAKDVLSYLSDNLDKDQYQPLYKGFPDTVKDRDDFQILMEQMFHYLSGGTLELDEDIKRSYHFEHVDYTKISSGTDEDFKNIFKRLAQSNVALAPQDFEVIKWFVEEYKSYNMPEEIPFKENLCMIAALGTDVPVKTATDILRIANYMSHGHSDLQLPPKKIRVSSWGPLEDNPERKSRHFKLSEPQKEYIVVQLEKLAGDSGKVIPYYASEMKERHKMWNKLAHHIHPTRFESKYPRAVAALRVMDSSKPEFKQIKTFASLVENATTFKGKIKLLMSRPGMLARSLNALMVKYHKRTDEIANAFVEVADRISNKVIFELWTYFEKRNKELPRKVKPLGIKRAVALPSLPPLKKDILELFKDALWRALAKKAATKASLGKVWLDEELRKIKLPTDMRTISESMKPVVRGSRMPLGIEKRYLNLFCTWEGGTDLDFTVSILNTNGTIEKVGYGGTGYKTRDRSILHSGDNTGNYEFNSEIVSVDLEKTNAKYLLAMVNVFSGTMASNNAKIGFEERDEIFQSKQYRPETTSHVMQFESQERKVDLFIIDVETREWVLVDEEIKSDFVADIHSIKEYIAELCVLPNPSVYDLLKLHAEMRGMIVDDIETADIVFDFETFSQSYDKIIEFMVD